MINDEGRDFLTENNVETNIIDDDKNIKLNKKRHNPLWIVISCVSLVLILTVSFILLATSCKQLDKAVYDVKYADYIYKYANENNINPNLVMAIIHTESHFNENAESQVGALGLMQLMPDTFDWLQTYKDGEITLETEKLLNPETNIKYGCIFIKFLIDRYTVEETAVAAYNAGFGSVDSWLSNPEYSSDGYTLDSIPYPETASYVEKVETAKKYYENNFDGGNDIIQDEQTAQGYGLLIDDRAEMASSVYADYLESMAEENSDVSYDNDTSEEQENGEDSEDTDETSEYSDEYSDYDEDEENDYDDIVESNYESEYSEDEVYEESY